VHVALLGPLEVVTDGPPITIGGARLRALLARLALDAGRLVTTDALIGALWPESAGTAGGSANALQTLVSRLRKALPDPAAIASAPAGYTLRVEPSDVDTHRFEELAARGRAELAAGEADRAAAVLRDALGLWRGPALSDVADAPFAGPAAARLDGLRLSALEDRIAADLELGRHAALVDELTQLVTEHPLREQLHGRLITALDGAGRRAEALAAYQRARTVLAETLGVDPSPGLQRIHLRILRDEPTGPARRSTMDEREHSTSEGPAARGNLRASLTSFVGRDADRAGLAARLRGARLVTLTGPGGAGKTRLACEVAATVRDGGGAALPGGVDGVWLVELAAVTDPTDLAPAVLTALGARETTTVVERMGRHQDVTERLIELLERKRVLLVLDNCEHLVAEAARVADLLLARCPGLRVLATSREPLGITGEALHPVPPLELPTAGQDAGQTLATASVRLFADRAAAVRPDWTIDDRTSPVTLAAVREVCTRLDGMPLAIELAAARLRTLPAEQIARRLDDRFHLLTGGSRTALPRHQTLRAVVDWSWELLDPQERALARRLSVFPGGITLEATERICADTGIPERRALDLLAALVDKSLLQPIGDRYRMLETIRAYGAERLAEAGETEPVHRAHARYFTALAETAEPRLRTGEQLRWLAVLDAEHANLQAALRWSIDRPEPDIAYRLAAGLGWYWTLRGRRAEISAWMREVAALPPDAPAEARALVLVVSSLGGLEDWPHPRALRTIARARLLIRRLDLSRCHPALSLLPVVIAVAREDYDQLEDELDRLAVHPDPWARAVRLIVHGHLADNFGRAHSSPQVFETAARQFGEIGDRWGTAIALSGLAQGAARGGDVAAGIAAYDEAMRVLAELRADEDLAGLLGARGLLKMRVGDLAGARADLDRAAELADATGGRESIALSQIWQAELARRCGDPARAEALLDASWQAITGTFFGADMIRALVLVERGSLRLAQGADPAEVRELYRAVAALPQARLDLGVLARAAELLAEVTRRDGDGEQAAVLLGAATRIRGAADLGNDEVCGTVRACLAELGRARYDAAYDKGAALDQEAALGLVGVPPAERRPGRRGAVAEGQARLR
jgi:predicted ATPase/DNA-binding SARP family transcriptional activator